LSLLSLLMQWRKGFRNILRDSAPGVIEGVAGPEARITQAQPDPSFLSSLWEFHPMRSWPSLGLLLTHGVQVGPLLLKHHSDIFWGVVTSMYIGNAMLLVLNLPLIGMWVKILKVPYPILFPLFFSFASSAHSANNIRKMSWS